MLHKYKVVDQRSQYCNAPLSTRSKVGQRGLATHVIRRALIAVSIVVAMAGPVGLAQPATTSHQYQGLVGWLASPQMEGRGPGTAGLDLARDFIARYFLDIDLKPAFGANTLGYGRAYTQQFEMSLGVEVKQQSLQLRVGEHALENAGSASEDYNTLGFSANGSFDGSVVFVGYGIVEPDFDYNSYVGVSKDMLADKVVVVFRYEPRGKDGRSRWSGKKGRGGPWSKAADLTRKARWAHEHGATALLIVNPPSHESGTLKSTQLSVFSPAAQMPVLHVRTEAFKRMLGRIESHPGRLLKQWQQQADQGKGQVELLEELRVRGNVELVFAKANVSNVAGVVPGAGLLADEVIVVGAHYDHLGYGGPGAFVKERQVHPGADDNASGTAGLLMLAERCARLARTSTGDRRTILFAAFTAEERGLLGSAHFVKHLDDLGISADQITAMINMDMIGRMKDDKLTVMGAGTSDRWTPMIKAAARRVGVEPAIREAGIGPSDHTSFYHLRIPVLHLFTGAHEDYHRPSDTADKINGPGALKVLDLIQFLIEQMWSEQKRLAFKSTKADPHSGMVAGPGIGRAYLGVIPDYSSMDGDAGCGLSGISPDSPAEDAGLKAQDVLVGWNDRKIGNVYDLTAALRDHDPNDRVKLMIQRDGKEIEVVVTLGQRG